MDAMGWMFTTPLKGEGESMEAKVKTLFTIVKFGGLYFELIQVQKLGSKILNYIKYDI